MLNQDRTPIVVLGAGPAGLGAAYRLALRRSFDVTVLERQDVLGGNAGSFNLAGLRADYGSHRLHPSCRPEILADIRSMLGASLLDRPRHGRILLRGRWVRFPLKPLDLALHLPPEFTLGVLWDAAVKLARSKTGGTFASLLEDGLGPTICRDFYFPYAEKIWGVPPQELDAEQARRRVSANSIGKMLRKVMNAVPGSRPEGSGRFYYPKQGFGAISESYCRAAIQSGARVLLRTEIRAIETQNGRLAAVVGHQDGTCLRLPARHALSTIPISHLVRLVVPEAPAPVLESAGALRYRAMILIYLVLDADRFTEYDAHYFPGREIPITRLSEPKNYSLAESPGTTVLCAELPCSTQDSVWAMTEAELASVVTRSLDLAGSPVRSKVRSVVTKRLAQAYPVYLRGFRAHFECLDRWIGGIGGLLTLGRQGLFAHDNTHHALAMAYAAAECFDDAGRFDPARWAAQRETFLEHVVED